MTAFKTSLILPILRGYLKLIQLLLKYIHVKSVRLLSHATLEFQQVKYRDEKISQSEKDERTIEDIINKLHKIGNEVVSLLNLIKTDPKYGDIYSHLKDQLDEIIDNIIITLRNFEDYRDTAMIHDILSEDTNVDKDKYELYILTDENEEK